MLTRLLVSRFAGTGGSLSDPGVRMRYGALEGWASIVVNLAVFAVKLVPGLMIGSIALIADAFHSLSDVGTSVVVIWGFRSAAKPSDREHPFGHGRVESVASLVIAVLLLVAAVEFGKSGVTRLLHPQPMTAPLWVMGALVLTIVAKEWLARLALELGRRIGSSTLKADFWHHRSDALSTVIVILALGGAELGVTWLDGAAGVAVAAFLAWAGIELVRESVDPLIGQAPEPELVEMIKTVAKRVAGVEQVHDVIVHHYGGLIVTSLHVEVSATLDVSDAHEIAERVQEAVTAELPGWATVHVDPINREHPLYGAVEAYVTEAVAADTDADSFHDLRIVGREGAPCYIVLDLVAEADVAEPARVRLHDALLARFPEVAGVVVNLEPRYVY